MADALTPAAAQAFLEANFAPWVLALMPCVSAVSEGRVTLEAPITDQIARVGGIVSGQTLATLADTAMVLACGAATGGFKPVATITLDTQFLRPGGGELIHVEAEVTRAGKSLIFCRASLTTLPAGKTVALATATFAAP